MDRYYYYDAHGDIVNTIDCSTDSFVSDAQYDAYGNRKESSVVDEKNPFGYAGEYLDEDTGFIYLRNRFYSPKIGRFISEDPIRDGLNWYVYAGNNPIKYIDPSGLTYIIAWSYGSGDVKDFEKYYNQGFGQSITVDGDTSDWFDKIWKEFDRKSTFSRAANTKRNELVKAGVPENEIILQRIDNKEELTSSWDEWAKLNVVDGIDFFSHGYSGGAEVYKGSDQFWNNARKLNWSGDDPYAKFYGCNTANGKFASNFANTQGVVTYGQIDYSNFSGKKSRYTKITTHGTSLDVYMGVYNKFLGVFKNSMKSMKKFVPE